MTYRSTFFLGVAGWLAAAYGCSAQEPGANLTRRKVPAGAGGSETSGDDGTGGDPAANSGGATTGPSVGATSSGGSSSGGEAGASSSDTGGAFSVGGAAGNGGAGPGSVGTDAGTGGAGGTNVTSGQCNATCVQGPGCSPKSCWMVSANTVKADPTIQPANAIDGDEKTRYSTGADAKGVEWFEVDLCRSAIIDGMNVYTGSGGGDVAEKYTVQVSLDGTAWSEVLHSDTKQAPRAAFTFAPVSARYVRFNQTAVMTHWWSIYELDIVCGSADGG